ncbi:MAG: hypothetical protein U0237_19900 [Thermoleophilia bacterium]
MTDPDDDPPPPPAARRGLPGMPLLSRWGLVLGVAILFAIVILGGNLFGGEANRVNAIADPLAELPAFPAGALPSDAPDAGEQPQAFADWAEERAFTDWRRAFDDAGRAWAPQIQRPVRDLTEPANDPAALEVYSVGDAAAEHVMRLLGIPGRIELARREKPETKPQLERDRDEMVACLAGAWGRTLLSPARLAAAAPAPVAESVRLGAEVGDPSVCDTFSTDGAP